VLKGISDFKRSPYEISGS